MFKSQPSDKKKQAKNPFRPVSPKKRPANQPQLSFFSQGLSKSSSSLAKRTAVDPLKPTSSSSLNRSSSTPNFFSTSRSKSTLSQMKSGSFDDSFDDDDSYIHEKPINLKNSKPVGSLISQNSGNESEIKASAKPEVSRKTMITPPASNEAHQMGHTNSQPPPVLSRQSSSSSSLLSSQQRLRLGTLSKESGSSNQTTLNFGGSQGAPKRKMNPWDSNVVSTKKIKNPRMKESKLNSSQLSSSNYSSASTKIKLSDEQLKVIDLVVKENKNVFYTGSAGTGKSVLLKELVSRLTAKYSRAGPSAVAVTASTGLAAVNIGGVTINKFSGMGLAIGSAVSIASKIMKNKQTVERWKRTKVLIIDEISMIDGSFLDKLEYVARFVTRNVDKPFGGIQVVLTGDFFQLPPVPNKNAPAPLFCFQAHCWNNCIQRTILLKQVFRQKDNSFVDLLNCLRLGEVTEEMAQEFQKLSRSIEYDDGIMPTELFCTRREVDQANSIRLQQLPGIAQIFEADDIGDEYGKKSLDNVMAVKTLVLKEDAQVMMLKNKDETLVNGTVGKVVTFLTDTLWAYYKMHHRDYEINDELTIKELKLLSKCVSMSELPGDVLQYAQSARDKTRFVELATFAMQESKVRLAPLIKFTTVNGARIELIEKDDFYPERQSETGAKRSQFPLLLSWALSIHKSQGQTIERVKVDLSKVFEIGQVYVALSRAVSKERLQIVNFRRDKIQSSGVVKRFYSQLESL